MTKKSISVILFILVTIGFLFGFNTYNKRLNEMLGKEIDPSAVVQQDPSKPPEQEIETPDEEEPEMDEEEGENPLEEPEVDGSEEEGDLEEPDETSDLVSIPNIIGLHKDEAVKTLEEMNLKAEIHLEYIDSVEKEYVFYQRPPKNQEVPEGTTVSFSVSRGPYGSSDEEMKAVVPSLGGKTKDQAKAALENANLLMRYEEAYSSQITKGNVISQDTAAGKEVNEGSTVTITVSLGKEPAEKVTVPDVVGEPGSEAESLLKNAGLNVEVRKVYSDIAASGTVISQNPVSTQVDKGSTVTITVSLGKELVEKVTVPDVIGKTGSEAESLIKNVGLNVEVREVYSEVAVSGNVVSQNPGSVQLDRGSTVTITVSLGKEPPPVEEEPVEEEPPVEEEEP